MKRYAVLLLLCCGACAWVTRGPMAPGVTLYAQTLPATKHLTFTQVDLTTHAIIGWVVTVDGVVTTVPVDTRCTGTVCVVPILVQSFGVHTVSIAAQNLSCSGPPCDPNQLPLTGPAQVVAPWNLNQGADAPTGAAVTN